MITGIEIIKYIVPANDRGMKRAREIKVYDKNAGKMEYFLAHQINDRNKVGEKVISEAVETVIVGALENYNPDKKMMPYKGNFIYEIKDKKFGREVYDEVKEKALNQCKLKGEITVW